VIVEAVQMRFVFATSSAECSTDQHYCSCHQFNCDSCVVVQCAAVGAEWSYPWI